MDGSGNGTVGFGPAGFGGLTWENALRRWIQASEAPDLQLVEVVKMSLPFFFILVGVEVVWSIWSGKKAYYVRQSWSNMGAAAMMYMILGIFLRGLSIFPYMTVNRLFAVYKGRGVIAHVLTFFATDLAYYSAHRWEHAANLGWAAHNMHHSSPDMNFLTGFRQAPDQLLVNWVFYLPIAFLAPVDLFFLYLGAMYFYQFLVHTEMVGRLHPVIEYLMVTPSHHRVHHARNYPRANYGGTLIIWDRIFGSFVPERDEKPCVYGLDERQIPLGTFNPLWQQGHHFWYTFKGMVTARGLDKLRVVFTRKHIAGMIAPAITDSNKDQVPLPPGGIPCDQRFSMIDIYVSIHGAVTLPIALFVFSTAASMHPLQTIVMCGILTMTFTTLLMLFNGTKVAAAVRNEMIRLCFAALIGSWVLQKVYAAIVVFVCIFSALVLQGITTDMHSHKD